ncbi:MAG: ATPase domain-containing protein [Candidatus Helarchaeota archaeon]
MTVSLDLNTIKGITKDALKKLNNNGIIDIPALATCTVNEVENIGIPKEKAVHYIEKARAITNNFLGRNKGFVSGEELLSQFNKRKYLSSACPSLDEILEGGLETTKIYEIYGERGVGKTGFLHQLIFMARRPEDEGGLDSPSVIYLDTERQFSIRRIKKMASYYKADAEEVIKSIVYAPSPTSDTLLFICERSLYSVVKETGARLILLDSIASHFRTEYGTLRQKLPERQNKIARVVDALKKTAERFNAVVVMTNQVTANPTAFGSPTKFALGHVMY